MTLTQGSYLLAELNTKRFTVTTELVASTSNPSVTNPSVVIRLGGTEVSRPIQAGAIIIGTRAFAIGDSFDIT
jgi:hypothetical protein